MEIAPGRAEPEKHAGWWRDGEGMALPVKISACSSCGYEIKGLAELHFPQCGGCGRPSRWLPWLVLQDAFKIEGRTKTTWRADTILLLSIPLQIVLFTWLFLLVSMELDHGRGDLFGLVFIFLLALPFITSLGSVVIYTANRFRMADVKERFRGKVVLILVAHAGLSMGLLLKILSLSIP